MAYFVLSVFCAIVFLSLYIKAEDEENYADKCWFYLVAFVAGVLFICFTCKGVYDIKNDTFNLHVYNNECYH